MTEVQFVSFRDPFSGLCMHGVEGARFIDGERKSPTCPNCFPLIEQEDNNYHDHTYESADLSSSGPRTPAWYDKWW